MQHRIETARIARRLFLAVTVWVMVLPVMGYAQTWPDPPDVNGSFSADDLARAAQIESELSCRRDIVYCSDPEVQEFKRRLQEVAAAALTRMPDIELRHDVVPSSVNLFHQNLLRCGGRYPLTVCSRSAEGIRGSHETLAEFPETKLEGDACAATVEKACLLDLLSARITAWNQRNTEDDENPVVALHDPGFDCLRGQRSAAMHTICRNGELSALHRVMLDNLAALPGEVDPRMLPRERAEILSDSYWYRATYDCQTNTVCIRDRIEQRIRDVAEISLEMQVLEGENTTREAEIEVARTYQELSAARMELAGVMDGIVADATMPASSFFPQPENTRAFQRAIEIARIEEDLSERARSEGRVYRGLWFWSQFRDPKTMRTVFRGNRTVPFTVEDGAIYFHNGYPLEVGHSDQMGVLTGWVRAYASSCGHLLPAVPDTLRIDTFTTSGPIHLRTTRLTSTDVLQFQDGLARSYVASREAFQSRQQVAVQENMWEMTRQIVSGGLGAVSDLARSQIGTYLYALDDFTRFFDMVGCDSPTARQMSEGIILVARGQSLPDVAQDAAIPGAEWVSDSPQRAGEVRDHREICWKYEVGVSHNICGCLVDLAAQRLGTDILDPTIVEYLEVHQAFMQAPETDQRLCRDPVNAISAGLLLIDR